MKKWTITVVPHTHWDKEWYFTKQDSDVFLSANLLEYLKLYHQNPNCFSFTYDGQTSIIEDYLTYFKDDNNAILFKALASKKLIVGPWYTQPDFFNLTSESIVRNLLLGITLVEKYHGQYLATAYVPDSFGHTSQMPQIYRQFGLNQFIYWRGARPADLEQGTIHWWEGLDGTKILAYNFYFGYWVMGSHFPYQRLTSENLVTEAQLFLTSFSDILNTLKAKIKVTNNILLPFGGDQAPISKLLAEFIDKLNDLDQEHAWKLADYDEYFADNQFTNLATVSGELKSSAFARVHKTIGSQRVDLKIKTKAVEYSLYNAFEPLATYYHMMGGTYPAELIREILKLLTTSQAHDSLGGCNSDETNRDIANRLDRTNDLIASSTTKLLKTYSYYHQLKNEEFLIFNPRITQNQNKQNYEVTLFTKLKKFAIHLATEEAVNFVLLEQNYCDGGYDVVATNNGEKHVQREGFYQNKVLLLDLDLPLFTISKFKVTKTANYNNRLVNIAKLKTKHWEFTINPDGSLDIYDLKTCRLYKKQFLLEADYDMGDSYDYSPSHQQPGPVSQLFKTKYDFRQYQDYYQLVLNNTYLIPSHEQGKMIKQQFELKFAINNTDFIELEITTKNVAREIRWRINATAPFMTNNSYANQAYGTIERPVILTEDLKNWEKEQWKEKPVAIETNESFVYLTDDIIKVGYLTRGNNEYEVINDDHYSTLWITLFRSVPFLGRNNLINRPGRASGVNEISVNTPDAQLLTTLTFNLQWFVSADNNLWNKAEQANTPVVFYQQQTYNSVYKHADRFLLANLEELDLTTKTDLKLFENPNFVIKAVKKSERNNTIIVRGFNASCNEIKFSFENLPANIQQINKVNLLEKENETNIKNDSLKKYQIQTYEIILKEERNNATRII
ncbi:glycoside hydrolase family 38 N-terminal domain-containing protein [Spiroplasma chrysopicola]|uniref:Alpha-mannosidase n=1 Tax=Spiroplasma chrysopicola DF-1 TaxID=1276227 RepID=R4UJA0_9MOLU|nr:glycosyl hydrolase-related protein [Spiroplasma chrysopicola]AGM25391.1 alpha-mannosidase [Spiroplasma chrysopicola DF-1]